MAVWGGGRKLGENKIITQLKKDEPIESDVPLEREVRWDEQRPGVRSGSIGRGKTRKENDSDGSHPENESN
jgi:hypothetical protein